MRWILAVLVLCSMSSPTFAGNAKGEFWTGGGVGKIPCTGLINTLATVRLKGGFNTPENIIYLDGYIMYLAGFQTAYDAMTPGV